MILSDPSKETFALGVAAGLSQSEAYRRARPNSLRWKDETVWKRASEMMATGEVIGRVRELQAQAAALALWIREQSIKTLSAIALDAEQKPSDRIAAVRELNAMHGYNAPQKIEHDMRIVWPVAAPLPKNARE